MLFIELMRNPRLQNLLYMVLVAGNFLNSVSYIYTFLNPVIILRNDESIFKVTLIHPLDNMYLQLDGSTMKNEN